MEVNISCIFIHTNCPYIWFHDLLNIISNEKISFYRFCRNMEAFASDFLENVDKMFPR